MQDAWVGFRDGGGCDPAFLVRAATGSGVHGEFSEHRFGNCDAVVLFFVAVVVPAV